MSFQKWLVENRCCNLGFIQAFQTKKGNPTVAKRDMMSFNFNQYRNIANVEKIILKPNSLRRKEQIWEIKINPFSTNFLLLYPLEISANRRFSYVSRGYKSGILVENRLIIKLFLTYKIHWIDPWTDCLWYICIKID